MKGGTKCLVLCLAAVFLWAGSALAAAKVVVVAGVTEQNAGEVGTYGPVNEGIQEALNEKNIEVVYQYVGLDSLPDEETRISMGKEAAKKAIATNPDAVVVLNDVCLKYVGTRIDDIPVVFAWIFDDPKNLGLPKKNITGVKRRSYAPDIWSLARQITGAETVALLSKDNMSMVGVKKYILAGADKLEQASGVRVEDMYLCNTFAEWADRVKNWKQDLIYLADTSRIQKDGVQMSSEEVVSWTVENANVPVIAATEKDTEAGALFSIVTSEQQIGWQAGQMLNRIIEGTPVSEIPIESSQKGKLVFNAKTVEMLNMDVPYDVLASADKIYE